MAYSITDFLTRVAAGNGIQVKSVDGKTYNIDMGDDALKINGTYQEIGNYYSKQQIADAFDLRKGIIGGLLDCADGTSDLI